MDKAKDLFDVPPSHTPHFTLGDNTSVIVLPDFLPLLREREVLIFRWIPDTPRSSLRRSVGGASMAATVGSGNVEADSSETSLFGKTARGVRWDESVVSNEEKIKRQVVGRPRGHGKDSAVSRHRAEYARQKIQEQETLRQQEQVGGAAEGANTSGEDPFKAHEAASNSGQAVGQQPSSLKITPDDLLASGSSPPSYTSPLPKQTGQCDEEQHNSSPLASPTRDVRGARKTDHDKMWMMSLGGEKESCKQQGEAGENADKDKREEGEGEADKATVGEATKDVAERAHAGDSTGGDTEDNEAEDGQADVDEMEEEAVEQATSPQRVQETCVRDLPSYQTMKSVVNQLKSHPSNHCFRQPCQEELKRFCQEQRRPVVDLFTISEAITLGSYGLEDPLKSFSADLGQMWSNIRVYYGTQSQQSQCAGILETFSGILLEEWKRHNTIRPIKPRPNAGRVYSTPMSRGEKHHVKPGQDTTPKTQQQAYFASLVAKTGFAPSVASPSRMLAKLGQTFKRPAATSSPRLERPAKRLQLAEQNVPLVCVSTAGQDAKQTSPAAVAASAPAPAPITTRGIAKRAAARAA